MFTLISKDLFSLTISLGLTRLEPRWGLRIYTLRDCRRPIAELKSLRGRCLGALRLGFVMLGVSTLRELWELWESSGRGVESCGSLGVVFYVSAKLREAQSVVFYVSGGVIF